MVAGKDTSKHLAKAASAPKLPPLPRLRVRKPDMTNSNPCLGVMSTVLGKYIIARRGAVCTQSSVESQIQNLKTRRLTFHRLLGIFRPYRPRLRSVGTGIAHMHGRKSKLDAVALSLNTFTYHLSQKPQGPQKSTINRTLSRLYPKIIGPHKRK